MATLTPAPLFSATVNINWVNAKGCDRDCDVEVEYTYDGGDDLRITGSTSLGHCELDDWSFDDLVYDAVCERAGEDYAEWLADHADYHEPDNCLPPMVSL